MSVFTIYWMNSLCLICPSPAVFQLIALYKVSEATDPDLLQKLLDERRCYEFNALNFKAALEMGK